jgi:hypothetical protein
MRRGCKADMGACGCKSGSVRERYCYNPEICCAARIKLTDAAGINAIIHDVAPATPMLVERIDVAL